jgi:hypothetical protein
VGFDITTLVATKDVGNKYTNDVCLQGCFNMIEKEAMQKTIRTKLDYLELQHVSKHDQLIYVQF